MRTRFCISSSICTVDFSFVRYDGVDDKRFTSMTSSWWSRGLGTIYIQDRKWGPDLVSQVLRALLPNFQSCDNKGNRKLMLRINTK